jgi:hypothetical protein
MQDCQNGSFPAGPLDWVKVSDPTAERDVWVISGLHGGPSTNTTIIECACMLQQCYQPVPMLVLDWRQCPAVALLSRDQQFQLEVGQNKYNPIQISWNGLSGVARPARAPERGIDCARRATQGTAMP